MAKALKIAGAVIVGAGLVLATGGVAAGFGLAATLGASSGVLGLSVGALILAGSSIATLGTALAQPKVPQTQTDRLYAQLNPREFRKTVLGQTAMPVDVRHEEWEGANQEWCRWVVAHASHAIDGVEEIWFGTELAWAATNGTVGKYRGYFFVDAVVLEGTPENALALSNQWNGTRRLTGCAYSAWRFKTTGNDKKAESPFSGGPPSRITVIGRGAKLYDPRRDSTVPGGNGPMRADDQSTWRFITDDGVTIGENLPLQILRMALGARIRNPATGAMRLATGSGVPARRINLQSFIPVANLADEQVNRSAGGTEPRYHGACVLSEGDEPRTWFETLCTACNARFRDTGGKLSIDIAHNDHAAAATDDGLTTDDVVGGHRWEPDASLEAIPNVVRGKYVDASAPALYQLIDYPEVRIASLDGVDRILSLDLGAVESVSHAQRVARQALQRKQYPRTFTAPFDIRAWKYPVGALVPFTYAPLSFKRMLFRVRAQELGQNGQCVMTLAYEHPSFYAWDADDRAPVMAADPVVYDATNNPLILAIGDAAKTADWSAVADDNGTRPEDGATVGAPAGTKVGNVPVEILIQQIEQIPQIETLKIDVSALEMVQTGHSSALAVLDDARIDMEAIQRQAERDAGKLSEATLRLLAEADRTRKVMRDAGIIVDPETGIVRIYAVDQLANRTTQAEIELDAQKGQIRQKASSDWVEEQIAKAILDPKQIADLEPILRRLATAEQNVDGLNGAIRSKAEVIELTRLGGRVKTAEENIDAQNTAISKRVEQTIFDGLNLKVQGIEEKLSIEGDTVGMSISIRQARMVADDAAEGALRSLLAGDDSTRRQIEQITQARQELTTRMDAGLLTEATYRLALAVEVASLRAYAVSETTALVKAGEVTARSVDALGVASKDQAGAIGDLRKASLTAEGGLVGVQTMIRQVAGRVDTSDEAMLRALIAGDEASRGRQAQLVQIQTELNTQLVANEAASAIARQALLARMNLAEAAIVETRRVFADNVQALVEQVSASESVLTNKDTGLAATRARLALEEKTSADRFDANVKSIEGLEATVNDPTTGLAAAFSTIGNVRETASKANEATAKAVQTLGSTVNDPATGLAAAFSTIGDVRETASKANQATARAVETLGSTVNDPTTGLAAAFSTIGNVRETASKANDVTAKAVEKIESVVNDPATGLAKVRTSVADLRDATSREDEALSKSIKQVQAVIDGVGDVGLQEAFEAVVDRLGKVEGRWSIVIDANGNLSGIQLIGSQSGPAAFNLINTDLKMGTGRVVFDTGTVMKVQGLGFGVNKDLVTWFGPTMPIEKCSRLNGRVWEGTDGKGYWGAGLSAGVLHVARQTPDLTADASIVIGPFGTKGGSKVLVVSYAYELTRTSTNRGSVTGKPTATIHLDRLDGESWALVQSFDVAGTTEYEAPSVDGDGYGRQTMGGAITFTDTKAGLGDFTYRARIASRSLASFNFNSPNAGREVQALSLSSTEE